VCNLRGENPREADLEPGRFHGKVRFTSVAAGGSPMTDHPSPNQASGQAQRASRLPGGIADEGVDGEENVDVNGYVNEHGDGRGSGFRYGPLEWLWRKLTYMQRQPLLVPASVRAPE
jgi:hypothetical protein